MTVQKKFYQDPTLLLLCAVTAMAVISVPSIAPALPHVMNSMGIDENQAGMIISAFTLPSAIFAPFTGVLADRIGRKRLLLPSLFIFGIIGAACAFAPSYKVLLLLRFLQGIAVAPLAVLSVTMIGDTYEGERRTWAMGYNTASLALGTAVFPLIGGFLGDLHWRAPFILPATAILIGIASLKFLKTEEPPKRESHMSDYMKGAGKALSHPRTVALLLMSFMTYMIIYGPFVMYIPLLLESKFGSTSTFIGTVQCFSSVAFTLVSAQIAVLTNRFGRQKLFIVAYIFYCIAWCAYPVMPNPWYAFGFILFFGIAQGINMPNLFDQLTQHTSPEFRGVVMSMNGLGLRLAQTLAPLLGVGLAALYGFKGVYWIGGVGIVIIMAVLRFTVLSEKKLAEPAESASPSAESK